MKKPIVKKIWLFTHYTDNLDFDEEKPADNKQAILPLGSVLSDDAVVPDATISFAIEAETKREAQKILLKQFDATLTREVSYK